MASPLLDKVRADIKERMKEVGGLAPVNASAPAMRTLEEIHQQLPDTQQQVTDLKQRMAAGGMVLGLVRGGLPLRYAAAPTGDGGNMGFRCARGLQQKAACP